MICSNCKSDLSHSDRVEDYRLRLTAEVVRPRGAVIDVRILPPIDKDHYFCGIGCLYKWASTELAVWRK